MLRVGYVLKTSTPFSHQLANMQGVHMQSFEETKILEFSLL